MVRRLLVPTWEVLLMTLPPLDDQSDTFVGGSVSRGSVTRVVVAVLLKRRPPRMKAFVDHMERSRRQNGLCAASVFIFRTGLLSAFPEAALMCLRRQTGRL
jgi:hypothetical protein